MAVSEARTASPPHGLDMVIDFVNTLDPDTGEDALDNPAGLARWLRERGLLARSARAAREAERLEAVELREALRALMLAHNGVTPGRGSSAVLDRVAHDGGLAVHFPSAGH